MMRNLNYFLSSRPELVNHNPAIVAFSKIIVEKVLSGSKVDFDGNNVTDDKQYSTSIPGFKTIELLNYLVLQINVGTRMANMKFNELKKAGYDPTSKATTPSGDASRTSPTMPDLEKKRTDLKNIKKAIRWLNPLIGLILKPMAIDIKYRYGLAKHYGWLMEKQEIKEHLRTFIPPPPLDAREIDETDETRSEAWEADIFKKFLLSGDTVAKYSGFLSELRVPMVNVPNFKAIAFSAAMCSFSEIFEGNTAGAKGASILKNGIEQIISAAKDKGLGFGHDKLKEGFLTFLPQLDSLYTTDDQKCEFFQGLATLIQNPTPMGIASFTAQSLMAFGAHMAQSAAVATRNMPPHTVAGEKFYYFLKTCQVAFVPGAKAQHEAQKQTFTATQAQYQKEAELLNKFMPIVQQIATTIYKGFSDENSPDAKKFKEVIDRGLCGWFDLAMKYFPAPTK